MEGRLLQSLRRYGIFLGAVAATAVITLTLIHPIWGIGTPIGLGWLLRLVAGNLLLGALNLTFINLLNTLGFRLLRTDR